MITMFVLFMVFCLICGVLRFVFKLSVGIVKAVGLVAILPLLLIGFLIGGLIKIVFALIPLLLIVGFITFISRCLRGRIG